jgi:hypothetical protein
MKTNRRWMRWVLEQSLEVAASTPNRRVRRRRVATAA